MSPVVEKSQPNVNSATPYRRLLNDSRRSRCPLCDSPRLVCIGSISYDQPILFSSTPTKLEKKPELWACKDCRSAFVQNVLPADIARQLYSQGDSTSRWSTVTFERHKTPEIVAELSHVLGEGKQHLDVGCSGGSLLDFSRERGCSTVGMDYSSITREHLERKGHAWVPSLESLGGREFDVITAFDLIEHLYDVRGFLQECCHMLRPGGRLVILTGNIDCWSARIAREHWWYVGYPEHIVFPSRVFFERLPNFKLEKWIPTYASVGYRYPFHRLLLSFLKRKAQRKEYTGLPSWVPDHSLIILTKESL